MRVAVLNNYKGDKKENLGALLERIHQAFTVAGLADSLSITFTFGDSPVPGFQSSVERALKKFPQLAAFDGSQPMLPMQPPVRQISNGPLSGAAGQSLDFATLVAVARAVPRPLSFHQAAINFHSPAFGEALPPMALAPVKIPGIIVGDSWWINGRNRSLAALTVVEADPNAKTMPEYAPAVAQVLEALGKPKETTQLPLPGLDVAAVPPTTIAQAAQGDPRVTQRVAEIVRDYRQRLPEIVDRAAMPHELPSPMEALQSRGGLHLVSGPKKPALEAAFKPLGYTCRGGSGVFTLRRRTAGSNLAVVITLDVGTWSNSLTGFYAIEGLGFGARLPLPPAKSALGSMQYSIGDSDRWQKIVENLAALVRELDRIFLPAIEAVAGPVPEWYRPSA